ncbi:hypothetical protein EVAR_81075_1 [Eumeta japonica]|uniref:Uncharacterized protein n=1 Tax=Eumeta variegata TaxID=151549 RepID=A0A4C1T5W8_EUMVA|nr:hypothetical protein EVAR_81075_1 [Eumeta japonica]
MEPAWKSRKESDLESKVKSGQSRESKVKSGRVEVRMEIRIESGTGMEIEKRVRFGIESEVRAESSEMNEEGQVGEGGHSPPSPSIQ